VGVDVRVAVCVGVMVMLEVPVRVDDGVTLGVNVAVKASTV
jgi:hypothetical protein